MINFPPPILIGALVFGWLTCSHAQQPPGIPPMGPPPEDYTACHGKTAGSVAELISPRGDKISGICREDANGKLVLRPDHAPGGGQNGHPGPPPEAYAACTGKTPGSPAQFTDRNGETVSGVCESRGERLVLRPDRPPMGLDAGQINSQQH